MLDELRNLPTILDKNYVDSNYFTKFSHLNAKHTIISFIPRTPCTMLCPTMLNKHKEIWIIAPTLFGGRGGKLFLHEKALRAYFCTGVHIILARIVWEWLTEYKLNF